MLAAWCDSGDQVTGCEREELAELAAEYGARVNRVSYARRSVVKERSDPELSLASSCGTWKPGWFTTDREGQRIAATTSKCRVNKVSDRDCVPCWIAFASSASSQGVFY